MTTFGLFLLLTQGIFIINVILIRLAYLQPKKDKVVNNETPFVSILVPVYNESVGVVDSVKSLLNQDYANFNIIVVDDGSTDNTLELLHSAFGSNDRVQIYTKENEGKAIALNYAASKSTADIYMCIDGDTILDPKALSIMISKKKPKADAVAAMVGIHNGLQIENGKPVRTTLPSSYVTRIQWLEYTKSYVIFRYSLRFRNAITVMSGACGLITREMFEKCGGFKANHLGEDMELTMNIHANKGFVQFLPETLAWTEAPANFKDLGKQRVRWYRGAIQALWEHRGLMFKKGNLTLNYFLIPYIWLADVVGSWVEAFSWLYILQHLGSNSDVNLLHVSFLSAYYVNTYYVVKFARNHFSTKYTDTNKAMTVALTEGLGYHFLFLYWNLKAQVMEVFKVKNKWNKLKRVGIN